MPAIRVSLCMNAGPKAGAVLAAGLCKPVHGVWCLSLRACTPPHGIILRQSTDDLIKVAANKLRLKKGENARARLFVWKSGRELLRGEEYPDLLNDTIIAVSLGEDYGGSVAESAQRSAAATKPLGDGDPAASTEAKPPPISGHDDSGRRYASLEELWVEQEAQRSAYYAANSAWWEDGGYNGSTDEAAMIGDEHSEEDVKESSAFLDGLLRAHGLSVGSALDAGAGVGRVTKHVLLKRCQHVHLVEGCETWSKQSRRYLGKKRSQACTFTHARLEEFVPTPGSYDLVWVQWTLQYLVDSDAIRTLQALKAALRHKGLLVLKENRPYLCGKNHEEFQMDTPGGEHGRFDITRPDQHHRFLFAAAGLAVVLCQQGAETNTWALR